jgi:uncharacterized protein YjaZ
MVGNGGNGMGVIRTDQWLENDFDNPLKICEKLKSYFNEENVRGIYQQLVKFRMYRPSRMSEKNFQHMKKYNAWEMVERLFNKYRDLWSGPDIPVFLFPLEERRGFFIKKTERNKSGVSYPDKMFLFLSNYDDPMEIEALFVHEYHHVCRLRALGKKMNEYTLLDSLIIEGLAEYAVLHHCGRKYIADWCSEYSEKELSFYWDKYLKKHPNTTKGERIHDELLFGGGRIPPLLGYAIGYHMVGKFFKNRNFSTKLTFKIPAEDFID